MNQDLLLRIIGQAKTSAAFSSVQTGLRQTGTAARTLQTVFRGLTPVIEGATRRLQQLGPVAQRSASVAVGAFQRIGSAARATGLVIGGSLAIAIAGVAKTGIDMNVTLTGSQRALERITGSAGAAAGLIAALRKEAAVSSLTFKEMLPIAQSLAAVYGPAGLGRVIPTMRAFQDTAAALRIDSGGLQTALYGFRQLVQPGMMPRQEELNQVGEALPGFNLREVIGKRFGTADPAALAKAGVTGRMVGDAIVDGMAAAFGGTQAQAAGSLPIILSNFQDAFNEFSAAVTARLTPAIEGALAKVLQLFQSLSTNEGVLKTLEKAFLDSFKMITSTVQAFMGLWEQDTVGMGIDWAKTWEAIKSVTVNVIKVVGGTISGLIGVFDELATVQRNGLNGFQQMAEAARVWALNLVRSTGKIISTFGMLIPMVMALVAAFMALRGNFKDSAVWLGLATGAGLTVKNIKKLLPEAESYLTNLDVTKDLKPFAPALGTDVGGAFSRGYAGFGRRFDTAMAGPGLAPTPPPPAPPAGPSSAFSSRSVFFPGAGPAASIARDLFQGGRPASPWYRPGRAEIEQMRRTAANAQALQGLGMGPRDPYPQVAPPMSADEYARRRDAAYRPENPLSISEYQRLYEMQPGYGGGGGSSRSLTFNIDRRMSNQEIAAQVLRVLEEEERRNNPGPTRIP
jgi:hypothetical protein